MSKSRSLLPLILGLVACCMPSVLSAASFDCEKARSISEKLICSNAQLSELDSQLTSIYQAKFKTLSASAKKDLLTDQREWLAYWPKRCGNDTQCAIKCYDDRIGSLKNALLVSAKKINWNSVVGIFAESANVRLDIGTNAVQMNIPASQNTSTTRLIIKRLDGPNSGPVSSGHLVGIFSEDGQHRLDIGSRAMKRDVPASHDSWATRLRIVRLNGLNLGPVTYGETVGIFSEDGKYRLDIGTDAMKEAVPASHESWATRLRIQNL